MVSRCRLDWFKKFFQYPSSWNTGTPLTQISPRAKQGLDCSSAFPEWRAFEKQNAGHEKPSAVPTFYLLSTIFFSPNLSLTGVGKLIDSIKHCMFVENAIHISPQLFSILKWEKIYLLGFLSTFILCLHILPPSLAHTPCCPKTWDPAVVLTISHLHPFENHFSLVTEGRCFSPHLLSTVQIWQLPYMVVTQPQLFPGTRPTKQV